MTCIVTASLKTNCMIQKSVNHKKEKKDNPIEEAVVLSGSPHSSDSGWSRVCVMGLPGFIQKRCSPESSCASLGACMQMS